MQKAVIGGVAAGVVIFIWGAVAHMALPIGEMGLRTFPDDDKALASIKEEVPGSGVYFFPGWDPEMKGNKEAEEAWAAKYEKGPRGLLIYRATGVPPMSPKRFLIQFGCVALSAILAGLILANVSGSYVKRVFLVSLLGPISVAMISIPQWNWYGFTNDFVLGEAISQVVGWVLAGLVLAAIVKGPDAS